jgi:hypothetical protein
MLVDDGLKLVLAVGEGRPPTNARAARARVQRFMGRPFDGDG